MDERPCYFINYRDKFQNIMSDSRVIGLISGKGGVGKTSLTVNLGMAMNEMGADITLIDADFSASNLGVHLGRYDHPVKIQDALQNKSEPANAFFRHPSGVQATVASTEIEDVEPDLDELNKILDHARKTSDYVLVDCPPGLDSTVEQIMACCDEIVIVTIPTQSSGINAAQIVEKAKQLRKPILGTIVNKSEDDPESELVDREVEMLTESHVMTSIPFDPTVKESLFDNQPFVHRDPLAPASLEVKELAAAISGREFERPSFAKLKRNVNKLKESLTS